MEKDTPKLTSDVSSKYVVSPTATFSNNTSTTSKKLQTTFKKYEEILNNLSIAATEFSKENPNIPLPKDIMQALENSKLTKAVKQYDDVNKEMHSYFKQQRSAQNEKLKQRLKLKSMESKSNKKKTWIHAANMIHAINALKSNRLKSVQSMHYGLRHIPSAQIHFTDGKTKKLQTVDVSEAEITKLDEYYGKHFNKSKLESSYKEKSDNNYIDENKTKFSIFEGPVMYLLQTYFPNNNLDRLDTFANFNNVYAAAYIRDAMSGFQSAGDIRSTNQAYIHHFLRVEGCWTYLMHILSHLYILLRLFGSSYGASSDFKYLTFITTVILTIFFFIDILLQYLMHRGMLKFWRAHRYTFEESMDLGEHNCESIFSFNFLYCLSVFLMVVYIALGASDDNRVLGQLPFWFIMFYHNESLRRQYSQFYYVVIEMVRPFVFILIWLFIYWLPSFLWYFPSNKWRVQLDTEQCYASDTVQPALNLNVSISNATNQQINIQCSRSANEHCYSKVGENGLAFAQGDYIREYIDGNSIDEDVFVLGTFRTLLYMAFGTVNFPEISVPSMMQRNFVTASLFFFIFLMIFDIFVLNYIVARVQFALEKSNRKQVIYSMSNQLHSLALAFNALDHEGKNYLTLNQFMLLLSNFRIIESDNEYSTFDQVFRKLDVDKDEKISLQEFWRLCDMLLQHEDAPAKWMVRNPRFDIPDYVPWKKYANTGKKRKRQKHSVCYECCFGGICQSLRKWLISFSWFHSLIQHTLLVNALLLFSMSILLEIPDSHIFLRSVFAFINLIITLIYLVEFFVKVFAVGFIGYFMTKSWRFQFQTTCCSVVASVLEFALFIDPCNFGAMWSQFVNRQSSINWLRLAYFVAASRSTSLIFGLQEVHPNESPGCCRAMFLSFKPFGRTFVRFKRFGKKYVWLWIFISYPFIIIGQLFYDQDHGNDANINQTRYTYFNTSTFSYKNIVDNNKVVIHGGHLQAISFHTDYHALFTLFTIMFLNNWHASFDYFRNLNNFGDVLNLFFFVIYIYLTELVFLNITLCHFMKIYGEEQDELEKQKQKTDQQRELLKAKKIFQDLKKAANQYSFFDIILAKKKEKKMVVCAVTGNLYFEENCPYVICPDLNTLHGDCTGYEPIRVSKDILCGTSSQSMVIKGFQRHNTMRSGILKHVNVEISYESMKELEMDMKKDLEDMFSDINRDDSKEENSKKSDNEIQSGVVGTPSFSKSRPKIKTDYSVGQSAVNSAYGQVWDQYALEFTGQQQNYFDNFTEEEEISFPGN